MGPMAPHQCSDASGSCCMMVAVLGCRRLELPSRVPGGQGGGRSVELHRTGVLMSHPFLSLSPQLISSLLWSSTTPESCWPQATGAAGWSSSSGNQRCGGAWDGGGLYPAGYPEACPQDGLSGETHLPSHRTPGLDGRGALGRRDGTHRCGGGSPLGPLGRSFLIAHGVLDPGDTGQAEPAAAPDKPLHGPAFCLASCRRTGHNRQDAEGPPPGRGICSARGLAPVALVVQQSSGETGAGWNMPGDTISEPRKEPCDKEALVC